jgi:hypothetical protein
MPGNTHIQPRPRAVKKTMISFPPCKMGNESAHTVIVLHEESICMRYMSRDERFEFVRDRRLWSRPLPESPLGNVTRGGPASLGEASARSTGLYCYQTKRVITSHPRVSGRPLLWRVKPRSRPRFLPLSRIPDAPSLLVSKRRHPSHRNSSVKQTKQTPLVSATLGLPPTRLRVRRNGRQDSFQKFEMSSTLPIHY